jgi:acyl-CoA thioester hydrolase
MMPDIPELKAGAGQIVDKVHYLPLRVYYEDTDVGGIVYYANYLKFMERGRSDMLRLAGVDQTAMMQDQDNGMVFAVRHCTVDYLKPARFEDEIMVRTRLAGVTAATLTMGQEIWRGDECLTVASVKAAVVGRNGRPCRLPPQISHILKALIF